MYARACTVYCKECVFQNAFSCARLCFVQRLYAGVLTEDECSPLGETGAELRFFFGGGGLGWMELWATTFLCMAAAFLQRLVEVKMCNIVKQNLA